MPAFGGISAAIALAGLAASTTQYLKSQKDKKKADADLAASRSAETTYQTPSTVNEQLADARSRNGAINPAILSAYQQQLQAQANQQSFAQRNASSGAQALSVASNAQAETQNALPALAVQQTGFDQQNHQNYVGALGASTDDARVKYQSDLERNQAEQQYALGQVGAANANKSQAIGLGLSALSTAAGMYGQYKASAPKIGAPPAETTPVAGTTPANITPLQAMYMRRYGTSNYRPYGF